MNRSCQRQTQVFDLPVAAMIAFVPRPSARQQHDPGAPDVLLRRVAVGDDAFKTLPVAIGEAEMEIPLRMRWICTLRPLRKAQSGLFPIRTIH